MRKLLAASGFSLVEVTLALGIAAFCLIAVFGIMPVGVQTNRNATSQTAATNIMAAVVADLRATPTLNTALDAIRYHLRHNPTTLYFDGRSCSSILRLDHPCGVLGLSLPARRNMELDSTWIDVCRFEGYLARSGDASEREWLGRNVCGFRQKLT